MRTAQDQDLAEDQIPTSPSVLSRNNKLQDLALLVYNTVARSHRCLSRSELNLTLNISEGSDKNERLSLVLTSLLKYRHLCKFFDREENTVLFWPSAWPPFPFPVLVADAVRPSDVPDFLHQGVGVGVVETLSPEPEPDANPRPRPSSIKPPAKEEVPKRIKNKPVIKPQPQRPKITQAQRDAIRRKTSLNTPGVLLCLEILQRVGQPMTMEDLWADTPKLKFFKKNSLSAALCHAANRGELRIGNKHEKTHFLSLNATWPSDLHLGSIAERYRLKLEETRRVLATRSEAADDPIISVSSSRIHHSNGATPHPDPSV